MFKTSKLLLVFILLSLVSLTADIVYEGSRSIGGSYLESINAPPESAAIASFGDFIGYATRFITGLIASLYSSSNLLWLFTITGYLAILSLPILAFTNNWKIVVTLYLVERIGKGMRTPARDTILADVTEGVKRGRAFGIHELFDQIGALTGPVIVALCITISGYRLAYTVLFIPALIAISLVITARNLYPSIKSIEITRRRLNLEKMSRKYWLYTLSMIFLSLGYIHWFIISYFLRKWSILLDHEIALAYMIAMGIDAALALPVGYLYDRFRLKSLYLAPLTALFIPLLLSISSSNRIIPYLMASLWGIVMAIYEVNMRVAVADLVEPSVRALAYGLYGLIYGVFWAIGGFILTYLINISIVSTIIYVTVVETASITTLYYLNKR
ncbi:MAG: MFS transporter [Desulfurococcaceae archaeon]